MEIGCGGGIPGIAKPRLISIIWENGKLGKSRKQRSCGAFFTGRA
jgi:hypothetical protein